MDLGHCWVCLEWSWGNEVEFYSQMLQSGIMPDQFTFGSIIKASSNLVDIGLVR